MEMIEKYEISKLNMEKKKISSINKMLEIFSVIHNQNFKKSVGQKYFFDILENYNYEMYILKDKKNNDNVVGYVVFFDTFDGLDLFEIAVEKENQGKGLGNKLLGESIERLFAEKKYRNRDREMKKIFLEVNEKNENAIKLYKKNGFEEISVRKNYYGNSENAIIMLKER